MQIFVILPNMINNKRTLVINVNKDMTIKEIKNMIYNRTTINPELQSLRYTSLLYDNLTLADYNINDLSNLWLNFRLESCSDCSNHK